LRFVNKKSLKTPIIFVNRSLKSKKEGKYNNPNRKRTEKRMITKTRLRPPVTLGEEYK
jgi:hypothetical protein